MIGCFCLFPHKTHAQLAGKKRPVNVGGVHDDKGKVRALFWVLIKLKELVEAQTLTITIVFKKFRNSCLSQLLIYVKDWAKLLRVD